MLPRFIAAAAVFAAVYLWVGGADSAASAAPPANHTARQVQRFERLTFVGNTSPNPLTHASSPAVAGPEFGARRQLRGFRAIDVHPGARLRSAAFAAAAVPIPVVPGRPVVAADPDFFGFAGTSNLDQSSSGSGAYTNTQYTVEPPDQGLCAGNGYVVDTINLAVTVHSSFGTRLTQTTPLNELFRLRPEYDPVTKLSGQFLSDPRCYFDRDTQRWFLTVLAFDVDPVSGAFGNHSAQLIAVSRSADPTAGYMAYSFDTTDAQNPGCPCFGDQPLLGADANGIFISTNEFPIVNSGFNGAQIYALSKRGLTTGRGSTVVQIDAGVLPTPDIGGEWYSIQPAAAPDTSRAARTHNGTEYLVSSLDFFNANDNRLAVWAITNTQSLGAVVPAVGLQHVVVASNAYGIPPSAQQKPGPTPLGSSLKEPLELLDSGDDRMMQVVYAAGRLWSGVTTAVRSGQSVAAGIAYFSIAPAFSPAGFLTARVVQQGYVSVAGQNIIYPSIGVNTAGGAVMAATLVGPDYFPTAVYVTQNGKVHVAGPGAQPDDGFTAYARYGGGGVARWGDYSAAVADGDGSIWIAAEYIPGGARAKLANWGTFLGHVQVHR